MLTKSLQTCLLKWSIQTSLVRYKSITSFNGRKSLMVYLKEGSLGCSNKEMLPWFVTYLELISACPALITQRKQKSSIWAEHFFRVKEYKITMFWWHKTANVISRWFVLLPGYLQQQTFQESVKSLNLWIIIIRICQLLYRFQTEDVI